MKKIVLISVLVGLLTGVSSYAAPAGTLSMDWSVVSSNIGYLRSASYNPKTGHMLLSVATGVIIVDGANGTILGALPPATLGPGGIYGICVADDGVIFGDDYDQAQLVRWADETSTPTEASYSIHYPLRGLKARGSGTGTYIYEAGGSDDNGRINILGTNDGSTFEVWESTPDGVAAAKTGATAASAGATTIYGFRPWGTAAEGVTKFNNIGGMWTKDVSTFLPDSSKIGFAVNGDIDPHPDYNVLYVFNYTMTTTYSNDTDAADTIVALDPVTGAYITRLYIGTNCEFYAGVDVDRTTHKIYWAARNAPYTTSNAASWGRMTYTIPLSISIDSVTLGPAGSVVLSAKYGTPPYSWSMSTTGIVSLSTTAGTSVIVTAISPGTVDVIVTDSASVSKTCTVVVVPTLSEVWSEQNMVIIHTRQPMGELFE